MTDPDALRPLFTSLLADLLVGGCCEAGQDGQRFIGHYEAIYLNFSGRYLRVGRLRSDTALQLEAVDQITPDFEIDEDDTFCTFSFWNQTVASPFADYIVHEIVAHKARDGRIVHLCIEAVPQGGSDAEYIWLDSTYYTGIRVRALPSAPVLTTGLFEPTSVFHHTR